MNDKPDGRRKSDEPRTEKISARVTPTVKAQIVAERGSAADVIERWAAQVRKGDA